jgi:hypothetical protein
LVNQLLGSEWWADKFSEPLFAEFHRTFLRRTSHESRARYLAHNLVWPLVKLFEKP